MSSRGYSNRGDSFPYINEDLTVTEHVEYFLKEALEDKKLPRGGVLQVQQVANVSAPKLEKKFYDPGSHILKLTLTDGKSTCYGLITDLDKSCGISISTPPGSKIKIAEEIRNVYGSWVHLDKFNVTLIGGRVGPLIDKWTLQKKLEEKHEWGSMGHVEGSEGPPQWKAFGQKLDNTDVALLRKMKAMDIVNEKKEVTENDQSEFAAQRSEAISELMDKSTRQNWQKPKKTLVDKDIQDIMNEGFTMDQAEEAMARCKNPQKALKFLKVRTGQFCAEDREERKDRRKKPLDPDAEEDAPIPKEFQRPTKSISLFGFIQGHIKDEDSGEPEREPEPSYDQYQSNYHDRGGRGGRRGNRGGGSFPRGRGGRGGYQTEQDRPDRPDRYDRGDQSNRDYGNRGSRYPGGSSYRTDDSRGFHSHRGGGGPYPSARGRDNYQSYQPQPPQRSYNDNLLSNASDYPPVQAVGSQGPPRFGGSQQTSFTRGGSGGGSSFRGYGGVESQRSFGRGDQHGPQSSVPYGGPQSSHTYPGRPQSGRGSRTYQYNSSRQN